jgi:hypothetical protein
VYRFCTAVVAFALFASNAFSADQASPITRKPPTEVKIISLPPTPPAQPAEVKVISMPALPVPQVVLPKDDSTKELVHVTWWVVGVTALLAVATVVVGLWASLDTKRRDRAAMLREVSRASHKVMTEATRVEQMAKLIPPKRTHLHVLMHQGGMPPQVQEETGASLKSRLEAVNEMVNYAGFAVTFEPDDVSPLLSLSDEKLTQRLWELDKRLVRLEGMRDAITDELGGYEAEIATRLQQSTAMQAAALGAKLSQPLKSTLG